MKQSDAFQWRKSSYSGDHDAHCVEVAAIADRIGIRDSKDPGGPVLMFEAAAFSSFIQTVAADGFGSVESSHGQP